MKSEESLQRIVILGHTGFIGECLWTYFRQHSPGIEMIGCSFPTIDLTNDEQVRSLASLFDINTVIIFCSGIKKQLGDSLEIFSQNIAMTVNVCAILNEHPVKRLVYFSSAEVYGEESSNLIISEKTPINPSSYYGIAKYASERLLQNVFRGLPDSSLLVVRPPLVYGPGDRSKGYGPTGFSWAAAKREAITLWGEGDELREFVFVEDLARAVYGLTFHNYSGVVNIVTGQSHTYHDILKILTFLAPFEVIMNTKPRTKPKVDYRFQNDLLTCLVPTLAFAKLEEGVKQTFDKYMLSV